MNPKKRNNFIDVDDVRSDYCCSFVRPCEDDGDDDIPSQERSPEKGLLDGKEVKDFYETVLSIPSSSCIKKKNKGQNNSTTANIAFENSESGKHNKKTLCNINDLNNKRSIGNSGGKKTRCSSMGRKAEVPEVILIDEQLSNDNMLRRRHTSKLLTLATQADMDELKMFLQYLRDRNDYNEILNDSDQFGWTAVMCAAAQGNLTVVMYLINEGCLFDGISEKTGKDVFDICKEKRQYEVLKYLSSCKRKSVGDSLNNVQDIADTDEVIKCELCDVNYPLSKRKQHLASMVHLFKDNTKSLGSCYGIPGHNKGFQMMLRSGWDTNQGLGPHGCGRKNPVKTILKQDRLGLGVKNTSKERVSHFHAFDDSAVKQMPKKRVQKVTGVRTYTRKKMKEKAWERNMRQHMASDF